MSNRGNATAPWHVSAFGDTGRQFARRLQQTRLTMKASTTTGSGKTGAALRTLERSRRRTIVALASGPARAQSRRLILTEEKIEGKIQKPEITIFITRQNLNTDYNLELKESFVPKIVESVERKPF